MEYEFRVPNCLVPREVRETFMRLIHDFIPSVSGDVNSKADKDNVLELDNTTAFTPDADYEPATKKYVDDIGSTDSDAIHDNVAAEINAVASKGTPVNADLLLIEDSADSNAKKKITLGDLPSGSGEANETMDAVPTDGNVDHTASSDGIYDALALKANDADVVHDTGNETVAGVKTFGSFPVTPSSAPSSNYETANKKYVDDNAGGGASPWTRTGTDLTTTTAGDTVSLDNNQQLRLGASPAMTTLEHKTTYFIMNIGTSYAERFLHNYGTNNVFLGKLAGNVSLTGSNNTGVGSSVLAALTSGGYNVAVGRALTNVTSGSHNIGIGITAGKSITSGTENTAIGHNCLYKCLTASYNIGIGREALYDIVSGSANIAIGDRAGYNAIGNGNVCLGIQAGYDCAGSYSVFIGYSAGMYETAGNKLYIANSNTTTPLIGGDFSAGTVKIGGTLEAAFKSSDSSAGITATIVTAKLTTGGANGSMTFKDGILTAQAQAT